MPTDAQTPGYTTKHGSVLPLIDTSVLEDSITSLINDVRLTNNVGSLIRESGLDNFAAAHSRLMADSKLLDAKAIEASCGSSGTQVVHWPQVKSFSYRGPATSPDTTTPTIYDKTAEQAASGIVENIHEGVNPYTKSSNYRYIGVGVVQTLDELGFMEFWITFYLTDCMVEAPTATSTAAATATPSPMPTATVPPTATPIPPLESTATSTQMATSTPPAPTATATLSSAPTATSTPVATTTVSPTPTATASPTHTAASFSLRDFTNGRWLEQQDPQLASSIQELRWTQDGVDGKESKAIQDLLYIAVLSRPIASSIVSLGWVQDDIDDVEARAIGWMNNIGSADVASSVVSLSWVQDGIDAVEAEAIESVSYISYADSEVASSVVSLGWMQDGIDALEAKTIEELSYMTNRDAEAALRIVGMPFLETIEPPDNSAIVSLRRLAASRPETLANAMSHPSLRGGISNDWAHVVATLHSVAGTNPGLIDILLDPARVSLERRAITLPLAGDVVLAIVRTGPGAPRSMDLLEHSVRGAEELMGTPLPTSYVGLLFENAVFGSNAGTNFGTHIAVRPKYDIDDGSHEATFAGSGIAHEVAHYYWSGNQDWIDEGAADFMASVIEGARTGRHVGVTNPPCGHASSISELQGLGVSRGDASFRCNYSLGERLFVDMHRTMGEERFQQGFRALYLASEVEDDADNLRGTSMGVEHIREAFRSDDGAESAVIARWYDGTGAHDLSRLDTTPVDSSLSSINGRIDEAHVSMRTDSPAESTFSSHDVTGWVYLTLKYSYSVSGGQREVPLEIVEYYEDGFEFNRRSGDLTAQPGYAGGTSWFSVGSPPSQKWAPGRYWLYVYAGDRKVAEVQYEVTP